MRREAWKSWGAHWAERRGRAERIIAAVARQHGVTVADIRCRWRRVDVVAARREAMVRVHEALPELSFPMLGALFERDHTTVMYAVGALPNKVMRRA